MGYNRSGTRRKARLRRNRREMDRLAKKAASNAKKNNEEKKPSE